MNKKYFILKDGKESGPISAENLKQKAANGELLPDDHIRSEGQQNWIKAAKAKGLFPKTETSSTASSTSPQDGEPLNRNHSGVFTMEDGGTLGVDAAVKATVNEFKSLDYGYLVPFKKIFSLSLLRKKAVRWVLAFGLFPLAFAVLTNTGFKMTSLWLGAYFCMFWATYFYGLLQPEGKVWRRGIKWAAFTATIGMVILGFAQISPGIRTLYSGLGSDSFVARLIGFVLGVGILEETCKALPFMLFVFRKKEVLSLKTGIFLGMMSGFGFALAEGMDYSMMYWLGALQGHCGVHDALTAQIVRFITLPLFHACYTGVVGWFAAAASQRSGSPWIIMSVGILFMATLHGVYDVFSDGFIGVGLAAVSILVFMGYLAHGEEREELLIDQPTGD